MKLLLATYCLIVNVFLIFLFQYFLVLSNVRIGRYFQVITEPIVIVSFGFLVFLFYMGRIKKVAIFKKCDEFTQWFALACFPIQSATIFVAKQWRVMNVCFLTLFCHWRMRGRICIKIQFLHGATMHIGNLEPVSVGFWLN